MRPDEVLVEEELGMNPAYGEGLWPASWCLSSSLVLGYRETQPNPKMLKTLNPVDPIYKP